jgi:pimeloyl-ACP methyl ester carboxylesterase
MHETEFETLAQHRLRAAGFHEKSLADLELPQVQRLEFVGTPVNLCYIEMGNTAEAETVIFSVIPYSTTLEDNSIKVRLAAQQATLGPETAVVGVQVYEPVHQGLSPKQRELIAAGSFEPFADRLLMTMQLLNIREDQRISLYGFSMGADVSTEAAYSNIKNQNRGIARIERLGVFEPVRVMKRGAIAVAGTFGKSGKNLYQNVIDSDSPALLEARGIDLTDKRAAKKHAASVNRGVLGYNRKDIRGNYAILRGFGHDYTIARLNEMSLAGISNKDMPQMIVARLMDSGLTPRKALARLRTGENLEVFEYEGDHSAADKLQRSGAFVLQAAMASST